MYAIGVIPARFGSSRFPGKPLAKIAGKTMLQRVWEGAKTSRLLKELIIATDSRKIKEECEKFGAKVVLTGKASSGTQRVLNTVKNKKCDVVVNIQGDEPLITGNLIDRLISCFKDKSVLVATLATKISESGHRNPNVVKVITDKKNFAIYFSRLPIPNKTYKLAKKHIGIYAYRKKILLKFPYLKSKLSEAENLEQLKFLENNVRIKVVDVNYRGVAVDRPSDIKKVLRVLKK